MVIFIPPYLGQEIKSNAERKMFDILQKLDMKNAYVFHSLGLPRHRSKIYGEIDFVVVCERGVACLEIKGGRIECRDGKWIFTDRYGIEREKAEGPFAQVKDNMFSLRDVLKQRFPGNPHMKNILTACGVVFPDIAFTNRSEEIIPEIVYDNRTDDITKYISGVFDYWQERMHTEPSRLSPSDIKEIVGYFRGEFSFIPALKDRLENVEQNLIRLTSEQVQIMDALSENSHLLIEGSAGTGKTLLAADFARKQAKSGKRVLFLTYNKNLAACVNRQSEDENQLQVINIHALFGEYVFVDSDEVKKDSQKYFSDTLPELFLEYISSLTEDERKAIEYDLIIMDEGQDILRPVYLYSLDYLLKGGLEKGNWAVFYDEKQNIYNPEYEEGMEIIESYHAVRFRLFINCRNTVQIGSYTYQASGMPAGPFIRENGEEVVTLLYSDQEDFARQVKKILKRLRGEQIPMRDVVFLSAHRYRNSLLADVGVKVAEMGEELKGDADEPLYSTIQGFKGLDSKVVILFGIENIREEFFQKYMYIAGTRARTLLYILKETEFQGTM